MRSGCRGRTKIGKWISDRGYVQGRWGVLFAGVAVLSEVRREQIEALCKAW